jgi:aminoglycoside phosphotransferase (APT) family kinase protein
VFASGESPGTPIELLTREANVYSSTFPSEVVTCRSASGTVLRLLCKYEGASSNYAFGHHGGVSYEAEIYDRVLDVTVAPAPRLHGTFVDPLHGGKCLVLEYLDGATRLDLTPDSGAAAVAAARRLGEFHATTEHRDQSEWATIIKTYDHDYYNGWAQRTASFSGEGQQSYSWLSALCAEYESAVRLLLARPQLVAHGECYPMNILVRATATYLVDWESAALAPGEIDLAALTEGWGDEVALACEREYCRARWPRGTSTRDFEQGLWAARLYWGFRWLGDRPSWTAGRGARAHFVQLRTAGEHLGLI